MTGYVNITAEEALKLGNDLIALAKSMDDSPNPDAYAYTKAVTVTAQNGVEGQIKFRMRKESIQK